MASDQSEFPELQDDNTQRWDTLAEWWDAAIGDGNAAQFAVEDTTKRFLALQPGERVLDVACGAGRMARLLAADGAVVTGIDQSEGEMTFTRVNAADRDALLALGRECFDAAVCTFALMDMPEIEPLASALPELLTPSGRFVFTVAHPVFNSGDARMLAEAELGEESSYSIRVTDYLTPRADEAIGVRGQPVEQWIFHRPLDLLLNTFFDHGLVLDRLAERAVEPGASASSRVLSWSYFPKIPQQLTARLRLSPR
ncbi:MAG: methyltransferase domain-containing protein [Gammaproteobacteria bacterium]